MPRRPVRVTRLAAAAVALAIAGPFQARDVRTAPAAGPIVFVGSSIFHRWTALSSQMAPLPIVNLAFDGAQTDDILRLVESRVVPYKPRVIVYYCGSNDVDAGETAAAIVDRVRQFIVRARGALQEVHFVFVSVIRAPEKQSRWDVVDEVNRLVAAYGASTKPFDYVDVNPLVFTKDGTPRFDLYLSDRLHFRPPAYEAFAAALKPVLTKAFQGAEAP
jgi:lysophospholipase L1-like esterase